MSFLIAMGLAILFLIATIVIFATKIFFPYHRIVALTLYGIGWIPVLYSITLKQQVILHYQETVTSFFAGFWLHTTLGITMLIFLYMFLILFPATKSPFLKMSREEIEKKLKEDETIIHYVNDRLNNLLTMAEKQKILAIDFKRILKNEKEDLKAFWTSYLEALLELDLLKERYKTFYQLNSPIKSIAFRNGYVSFMAQHYYTLQLQKMVANNASARALLNEAIQEQGIKKDTYLKIQAKLTDPNELLRLSAGRAYNALLNNENSSLAKLITKYLNEVDISLNAYTRLLVERPLSFLERNSFKLWFPIQKQSAIQMSYIRATRRAYHITAKQINQHRKKLQPGDILLQRREWHATNVGIPGYWTHTALYMGTLDFLDTQFKNVKILKGKTFSAYIQEHYPHAYSQLIKTDEDGYRYAVIEARRPGVVFMSLEKSNNADALAVLRVKNLTREKQCKILIQALRHLGKPYDFNFNFVTDDALVCSELVCRAYQDVAELSMTPQELNGRLMISPNQFAKKFAEEFESDSANMELVLFLDGNEKKRIAKEKGAKEFITTWKRPKWHIAHDFINFE